MEVKRYRITKLGKIILIEIMICTAGLLCGFVWEIKSETTKWDKLIYPGIKIEGLDLSGKTKEEAIRFIKSNYVEPLLKSKVNMYFNSKSYSLDISELIKEYTIDSTIDAAYHLGKSLPTYQKLMLIRKGTECDYRIRFEFNDDYLKSYIKTLAAEINSDPVNAEMQVDSDKNLKLTPDINGFSLKEDELEANIRDLILNNESKNFNINIPVEIKKAKITSEELSSINSVVASFSTDFSASSIERKQNVELATKLINGKILMPEDTFSFNSIVGERTAERGFASAPVIIGDRVESGLGGGICQVSSTLYNAILYAGLKPKERINHSIPSSYVRLGLDATVDWGNIDFIFQNTLKFPLFISAYTIDGSLHMDLYSNTSLTEKKYILRNDVNERIKSNVKTIIEPDIPYGQSIVVKNSNDGFKVRVSRDTYENGILINSEIISNDYYPPIEGLIKKGAK